MNIAIISSSKDEASVNIKENLINSSNFNRLEEQFDGNDIYQYAIDDRIVKIYTINSELVYTDDPDKKIDADLFIFISRHSAKDNRRSVTTHVPGNFWKANLGGKEKMLCMAPTSYLKNILHELNKNSQDSDYEATIEATHHGPFSEKPILFVEIGNSEKEWEDKKAGNIIAKTVINVINNKNKGYESIFVIGGTHYNHVANKLMLETDFASGHICAKYNLENLDIDLIKQAMKKTIPESKFVLLDWKGLGKEKQRILDILNKNNIEYKRSDQFFGKE